MLTLVNVSYQQNENEERINEGASTSQELTSCEICELENYADCYANYAMNLSFMLNNRFHELEAFHNEVFSYIFLAENGLRFSSDKAHRVKRLDKFLESIRASILKVLVTAYRDHIRSRLWYKYDHGRNIIIIRENISLPSDLCLCENSEERLILREELLLPCRNPIIIDYQLNNDGNVSSMSETSLYHIVPLPLILKFFEEWLSVESLNSAEATINDCILTLIGRLRRSLQKLMIVRINDSNEILNEDRLEIIQSIDNNDFTSEIFTHASS